MSPERFRVLTVRPGSYMAISFGRWPDADRYAVWDTFEQEYISPWMSQPQSAWRAAAERLR